MTTSYPGAVDNFTNPTTADPMNSATVPHATQHANANDAIEAIETVLGTNPQGTSSTVKDRIVAAEGAILNLNLAIDERVVGETGSNAPGGALPNGYVWVNTTDNSIKVWNGTTWVDPSNAGGGSTGPTWAVVSGGTVTEYTHPTYGVMQVHTFSANGTLTVATAGLAEVLLVSGGAGSYQTTNPVGPGGGDWLTGLYQLPSGAQTVTVGPGGTGNPDFITAEGKPSVVGSLSSGYSYPAGGQANGPTKDKVTSSIRGTAETFCGVAPSNPSGTGKGDGGTVGGNPGIVIVAVKKP